MSTVARVHNWLDERLDLKDTLAPLEHKTVPMHRLSYWYFLGGITLFLFLIQVCTGILLLLYYRPSAGEAYESVQYITSQVRFGWLIRSIHSWSANLMVLTAFAHMFSVLFLRAYRKPRELTWVSGMALLGLSLTFGFSGYLLPWNTLAFFATKVGTEVAAQVPLVGHWMLVFLRGGEDVTGATLGRFFGFHVAVLPGITTLVVGVHLLLVQKFGISVPPSVEREATFRPEASRPMKFFPNFFLRELMAWYIALAALGVLAALSPWGLGLKADPFAPAPAGIKPEWYFLWMFQTLKLIPSKLGFIDGEVLGVLSFAAAGLVWTLVPFLEGRSPHTGRKLVLGLAVFAVAYMASMTVYGFVAK